MLLSALLRKVLKAIFHFIGVSFEKTSTAVMGFLLWFVIEVYMWWNEYTKEQKDGVWDSLIDFADKMEVLERLERMGRGEI